MNASKFGRFEDEMIGLPNDISIKSRSISFPLGTQYTIFETKFTKHIFPLFPPRPPQRVVNTL